MAMAMFKRTFARTITDNLRAPHMKFGVSRQKGTESSPELRPEHYHGICITMLSAPPELCDGVARGKRLVKPNHCASWPINFMQVPLLTTSGFYMPSLLFTVVRGTEICKQLATLPFNAHALRHRWLLQESKRPLPRKLMKKSEKGFPESRSLPAPKKKKLEKDSKMTIFQVFFGFSARFRLFFDSFFDFFDPGAERPWEPLFRLFPEFSRERPS